MLYRHSQLHDLKESDEMSDNNNQEEPQKKESNDEIDHELEKIRLKRMQSLLKQKQQQEQRSNGVLSIQDKIRMVLQAIMTPEAFRYFLSIQDRDNSVSQRILQIILPPSVIQQIDLLIQYLSRGMLRSNIIDMIEVQQLERKIMGIGPRITVKKRDGESTDLSSFIKNNK